MRSMRFAFRGVLCAEEPEARRQQRRVVWLLERLPRLARALALGARALGAEAALLWVDGAHPVVPHLEEEARVVRDVRDGFGVVAKVLEAAREL